MDKKERLDVDIRFLLANERTLLAWVRTGLALQAGGFAIAHFSDGAVFGIATGIFAIILGALAAIVGYKRYTAADTAIRNGVLPHTDKTAITEVVLVILTGLVLTVGLLFGMAG
jgi:putative membrane protein